MHCWAESMSSSELACDPMRENDAYSSDSGASSVEMKGDEEGRNGKMEGSNSVLVKESYTEGGDEGARRRQVVCTVHDNFANVEW